MTWMTAQTSDNIQMQKCTTLTFLNERKQQGLLHQACAGFN